MDNIADSLNSAYQEFISAAATTLEANENSGGQKTPATDAALENFKQRWELFRVACDQAEEFVESVKQRIGSECLIDEATGSVAAKPGQPSSSGLQPISAVRLEQMSKAVRWLVIELQQESGAGGVEVLRRIPTHLLLLMLGLLMMLLNREERLQSLCCAVRQLKEVSFIVLQRPLCFT